MEHGPPSVAKDKDGFLDLFERGVSFGFCLPYGSRFRSLSTMRRKYQTCDACDAEIDLARTLADHSCRDDVDVLKNAIRQRSHKDARRVCRKCEGPLVPERGGLDGNNLPTVESRWRIGMEDAETAAVGQLFRVSRLRFKSAEQSGPPQFLGHIDVDSQCAAKWLCEQRRIFVGGSRSIAGKMSVRVEQMATDETAEPKERSPNRPTSRRDGLLCIRLDSPMILVDDFTRPVVDPSRVEDWDRILGEEGLGLESIHHWSRIQEIRGWHAASNLPKPVDIALSPGSILLFKMTPRSDVDDRRLRQFSERSFGLRTTEGFGRISLVPEAAGIERTNHENTGVRAYPMRNSNESTSVRFRANEIVGRELFARSAHRLSKQPRSYAEVFSAGRNTKGTAALRRAQLVLDSFSRATQEACSLEPTEVLLFVKKIRLEP